MVLGETISTFPRNRQHRLMNPKVGDKVVYHGFAFCMKRWQERLLVKPGAVGTVVTEEHLEKIRGLGDDVLVWIVDFGQGRTVRITGFNQEFRRE